MQNAWVLNQEILNFITPVNINLKCLVRCWVRFDFVVQCLSQYLVLDIMFFFLLPYIFFDEYSFKALC